MSNLLNEFSETNQWSARNCLNINGSKPKEMFLFVFNRPSAEPLKLDDVKIQPLS
jgi:hypothetical protein